MATQYNRVGFKDFIGAIKARWRPAYGWGTEATNPVDYAVSNGFLEKARSFASTNDKPVWKIDTDDALQVGGEAIAPMAATINFPLTTNASIVSQHFFIAPIAMEITDIQCVFSVADGAANTGYITHETGTQAPGTGATVMNGTFNLNATANTVQAATLWVEYPSAVGSTQTAKFSQVIRMAAGDRLSFKIVTAVTSLAGLVVSIAATPGGKGVLAVYNLQANGDIGDQTFFVANRPYIVSGAYYVHSTKCSVASVVVQITKDTSTNAPGAGTDILTNNTNTGFACDAANNTVQTGTLTATAATRLLAPSDRLAVDYTGTLTDIAGVVIVVVLQAVEKRKEVTLSVKINANIVDQAYFIADRNYEITDAVATWSTASATGNIQLTVDSGTTAPGGGTDLLSMDTNTGWQTDGTANTPEVATWINVRNNYLMRGQRLSVDCAVGASLAGFCCTVSLRPC